MQYTRYSPALRAIDTLKRGYAVRLHARHESADIMAAEHASTVPLATLASARVVVTPERARQHGMVTQEAAFIPANHFASSAALIDFLHGLNPNVILQTAVHDTDAPALALIRASGLLPVALVMPPHGGDAEMLEINASDIEAFLKHSVTLQKVTSAPVALPLKVAESARVQGFMEIPGSTTHLALLIGESEKAAAPLVRLHSSCLTGDLLGSLRCECGDQLQASLAAIAHEGSGVLLYLNQEGRGIGLAHKLRAYALQEKGVDTADANERLGFKADERDFSVGAEMLKQLGITSARLLTNNPSKVAALQEAGVTITERIPLSVPAGEHNKAYLDAKAKRFGHLF